MRTPRRLRRPLSLLLAVAISTLGLLAAGGAAARPAFAASCIDQCANYALTSGSTPSPGNLSAGDTVTVSITSKSQTTDAVAIPAGDQLALYYTTSKGHQCTTQPNSACTLAGTGDINMPTASISFTIPSTATYIWWDAWAVVGATNLSSAGDFEYCAASAGAILGSAGGGTVTLTANGSTTSGTLTVASGTTVTLVGSMYVSSGTYPGALYVCDTTAPVAYEEATSNATSTPAASVSETSGSQTYVAFASTVGGDENSGTCPDTNGVPIGWANSGESSEVTVTWQPCTSCGSSETPTGTTVTASPSSTTPGSTVTLTSTTLVSSNSVAVPLGDGTVTFGQGGTTLCSSVGTDSSGQATCATSALPTGTDTVTATYSGGNGFASSSGTTTVQIGQPANAINLAATQLTGTNATNNQVDVGQMFAYGDYYPGGAYAWLTVPSGSQVQLNGWVDGGVGTVNVLSETPSSTLSSNGGDTTAVVVHQAGEYTYYATDSTGQVSFAIGVIWSYPLTLSASPSSIVGQAPTTLTASSPAGSIPSGYEIQIQNVTVSGQRPVVGMCTTGTQCTAQYTPAQIPATQTFRAYLYKGTGSGATRVEVSDQVYNGPIESPTVTVHWFPQVTLSATPTTITGYQPTTLTATTNGQLASSNGTLTIFHSNGVSPIITCTSSPCTTTYYPPTEPHTGSYLATYTNSFSGITYYSTTVLVTWETVLTLTATPTSLSTDTATRLVASYDVGLAQGQSIQIYTVGNSFIGSCTTPSCVIYSSPPTFPDTRTYYAYVYGGSVAPIAQSQYVTVTWATAPTPVNYPT